MIKKTKKNVASLKWFAFLMWFSCTAIMVGFGYLAGNNQITNTLTAVVSIIVSSVLWLFWFYAFMAFQDIQDEIEEKEKNK